MTGDLLLRIDAYLDAVPRSGAVPEDVGPFTLFRAVGPFTYYARPRHDDPQPVTVEDVGTLADRCRQLGLPLSIEWVTQITPTLADAATRAGLGVVRYPLLAMDAAGFAPVGPPAGFEVRFVGADDPELLTARGVADVGFGAGGVDVGPQGAAERDEQHALITAEQTAYLQARAATGLAVNAVAVHPEHGVVATGVYQPVDATAELVGIATLPSFRRQGLGGAVTSALLTRAFAAGVDVALLSAGSEDVARVYTRLGFRRVGEAGGAEPASQD